MLEKSVLNTCFNGNIKSDPLVARALFALQTEQWAKCFDFDIHPIGVVDA